MSKYLRTKDGVYEILGEYYTQENTNLISIPVKVFDVKVTLRNYKGAYIKIVFGNEIISQADTIEELCDKFVLNGDKPYMEKNLKELLLYREFIGGNNGEIYGAIWTDKGLIYVAKMNEKGELELI